MTECTFESCVSDLVIEHAETLVVLQTLSIDYCCGGKSLEFACREQGLKADVVLTTLLQVIEVHRGNAPDPTTSN